VTKLPDAFDASNLCRRRGAGVYLDWPPLSFHDCPLFGDLLVRNSKLEPCTTFYLNFLFLFIKKTFFH
jgi:hypothetical protein